MFYPMMMYPGQNSNMSFPMMPMTMNMNMPTTQEGDKTNQPQQPVVYMMPVCFCDPKNMPKEMKMPFFPYPISCSQPTTEKK